MSMRIYRIKDIQEIFGVSRSCVYSWIKQGALPRPVKLVNNGRAVGWPSATIESLVSQFANKEDGGEDV